MACGVLAVEQHHVTSPAAVLRRAATFVDIIDAPVLVRDIGL